MKEQEESVVPWSVRVTYLAALIISLQLLFEFASPDFHFIVYVGSQRSAIGKGKPRNIYTILHLNPKRIHQDGKCRRNTNNQ